MRNGRLYITLAAGLSTLNCFLRRYMQSSGSEMYYLSTIHQRVVGDTGLRLPRLYAMAGPGYLFPLPLFLTISHFSRFCFLSIFIDELMSCFRARLSRLYDIASLIFLTTDHHQPPRRHSFHLLNSSYKYSTQPRPFSTTIQITSRSSLIPIPYSQGDWTTKDLESQFFNAPPSIHPKIHTTAPRHSLLLLQHHGPPEERT